jgi:hypothetical protein
MCRGAFDELRIDCPLYPELGMAIRFDDGTELVGLNSCRAETGYTQAAGFVGLDQLLKLCAEVKGPKHKVPRIAILHHSLLDEDSQYLPELFRDLGDHHVDTLCDGLTIRDAMPRLGFSLVLHGHIHQVKEYPAAGLDVRSAASVSVRFPESLSLNQFQVLDLNGRDLKIHCFRTPSPSAEDPVWEHRVKGQRITLREPELGAPEVDPGLGAAGDRLPHHPPVHAQLSRHPFDRSGPVLILTPDLLEKFHLPRLPSQPASILDRRAQNRIACLCFHQGGQIRVSKWANSE